MVATQSAFNLQLIKRILISLVISTDLNIFAMLIVEWLPATYLRNRKRISLGAIRIKHKPSLDMLA